MSPAASDLPVLTLGGWVLVAAKESFIGVLLGLGFGMFVWAVQSVRRDVGQQGARWGELERTTMEIRCTISVRMTAEQRKLS